MDTLTKETVRGDVSRWLESRPVIQALMETSVSADQSFQGVTVRLSLFIKHRGKPVRYAAQFMLRYHEHWRDELFSRLDSTVCNLVLTTAEPQPESPTKE